MIASIHPCGMPSPAGWMLFFTRDKRRSSVRLYHDEIAVSAYNSDTEAWRLVRIERVIGYICALSDHSGNYTLLSKIAKLHDHKGILTVTWRNTPSDAEKEIISKAWRSRIGDGVDNVEHESI
jgi:hypothetical protein